MGHSFKDILFLMLDWLGVGLSSIQIYSGLDTLLKSQEKILNESGLTTSHEQFLFWYNVVKTSVIFTVTVAYFGLRIYVYYKKNVKKND